MWGGTISRRSFVHTLFISIHPPLVGWDQKSQTRSLPDMNFNPPTPCGVGQPVCIRPCSCHHFNPPTPCGVGLLILYPNSFSISISIHPPLVGWDACFSSGWHWCHDFNPPTPCGVGLVFRCCFTPTINFNPPTPCGVGRVVLTRPCNTPYFNPPTPCGVGPTCEP